MTKKFLSLFVLAVPLTLLLIASTQCWGSTETNNADLLTYARFSPASTPLHSAAASSVKVANTSPSPNPNPDPNPSLKSNPTNTTVRAAAVTFNPYENPHQRKRVRFCKGGFSWSITKMLQDEYGFQVIGLKIPNLTEENGTSSDVTAAGDEKTQRSTVEETLRIRTAMNEWDLIYGGYVHCGLDAPGNDYEMREGLNKFLRDRRVTPFFTPKHLFHTCPGCKQSYCNKRQLCHLLRAADPDACYVLPDDMDRLRARDGEKHKKAVSNWVVKRDSKKAHLHAGTGVFFIKDHDKIAEHVESATQSGEEPEFLAMPYFEPFLGYGKYRRKSEMRVGLAITSTCPMQVYMYEKIWVSIAGKTYTNSSDKDRCIHDTHAHSFCTDGGLKQSERTLTLDEYISKINAEPSPEDYNAAHGGGGDNVPPWAAPLPPSFKEDFLTKIAKLLANVVYHEETVKRDFQGHDLNQALCRGGAQCFSWYRADIGVTADGLDPILFEVNEFPYVNEEQAASKEITTVEHLELFDMIGLKRWDRKTKQYVTNGNNTVSDVYTMPEDGNFTSLNYERQDRVQQRSKTTSWRLLRKTK